MFDLLELLQSLLPPCCMQGGFPRKGVSDKVGILYPQMFPIIRLPPSSSSTRGDVDVGKKDVERYSPSQAAGMHVPVGSEGFGGQTGPNMSGFQGIEAGKKHIAFWIKPI